MDQGTSAADWPLTGRSEELDLLRQLRSASPPMSAFLSGPAGVGKSRLARAALEQAGSEGWATLAIQGSSGFAAVPLGPFRTVLRMASSDSLTDLTDSVSTELAGMRGSKGLLLFAEDCQDLDEASVALLRQLVTAGLLVAIFTSRSGSHPPSGLSGMWMDGSAERIELQNLSRLEVGELLEAGLGGSVQDSTVNRIWQVTSGNPLYLREVILSSGESGALRQVDGEWRWRGEWAKGSRLQEVVAARLGRLDPDELTAMEMLAVARSLPLELVISLTTARAVEELEARALVRTERSGRRLEIEIAHPLHAEVLRSTMQPLQQRAIRHNLANALTTTGARRTTDRVRLACWSIESGVEVDPVTLSLGADASLFAIGPAISARLREVLPEVAVHLPATDAPVGEDLELAVRLAQAAYDRTGKVAEGVALASAFAWTGATDQAEAVLAELSSRAEAVDERVRLALALGFVRFWGRYDTEGAEACLLEVDDLSTEDCEPVLLATVYEQLAGIALQTGRPLLALEYSEHAAIVQGVEVFQSVAVRPAPAALTHLGRCSEAIALIDKALPEARVQEHPLTLATLLFTRAGAQARMGDLEEARKLAEWCRDVALSGGMLDATANYGVLLGGILLRQGLPASAGRIFQDAAGLLAERDVLGYRPWALAGLARARAQAGEEEAASAALDEARRTQPIPRHYDMNRFLAEIEVHCLIGRRNAAVDVAREAVDWARAAGMVEDEAQALDAWVRIAPSPALAERLTELAALADSTMVGLLADHARALVSRNPDALLEVSEGFAALTAWRLAADAANVAAGLYEKAHKAKAARVAARSAEEYGARCEGSWRPANVRGAPAVLSKREREIAILAAEGRSNKEIAQRMYLSRRTVDNHLYHVYIKLGVSDRAGLAALLIE